MKYVISVYSQNLLSLTQFCTRIKKIIEFVTYFKSIRLPKKIQKITVLRSPHVNKKSREQFETRLYKQVFILTSSENSIIIALLKKIQNKLPANIVIKLAYIK
jgi:small subunit ribosomal protein S10